MAKFANYVIIMSGLVLLFYLMGFLENTPHNALLDLMLSPEDFENSDLLITSDCVPFTYPNFHKRFLKDKILIILCPKLDSDLDSYVEKLTDIIKDNDINSITMVRMEIPCCRNLENLVVSALKKAGKTIILKDYIISVQGNIV
jgi:hypothetical protein